MKRPLTSQQSQFVEHYARTGDVLYAAHKAGVARPEKDAYRTLHKPAVQEAVAVEFRRRLGNVLVKGLARCEQMLDDPKTPNKDVINITRVAATAYRGESASDGEGKDPADMTGEEIQRRIDRLRSEAAARAKPIIDADAEAEPDDLDDGVFG